MNSILELKGVYKKYEDNPVLCNLNFVLHNGEIVGFLGKNGSGKTTTIRLILGLLQLDQGEILFDGTNIKLSNTFLRKIGYVQQNGGLLDDLTLYENVELFAKLHSISHKLFKNRFEKYLEIFQMTHLCMARLKTFSKGMKQKVGVIRSLIHNPSVLLLDEPLTGLDPWERENTIKILKEFHQQGDKTILLSTHIVGDLEKMATRLLFLQDGYIQSDIKGSENINNHFQKLFFK